MTFLRNYLLIWKQSPWAMASISLGLAAWLVAVASGEPLARWAALLGTAFLAGGAGLVFQSRPPTDKPSAPRVKPTPIRGPALPRDVRGLAQRMIEQGRYALLVRPQIRANLSEEQFARAKELLASELAMIPAGQVDVSVFADSLEYAAGETPLPGRRIVALDAYCLDRYAVTNRQFHEFVLDSGYETPSLWRKEILPAVANFVDRSGQAGPRFWNGGYPKGEDDLPVVGVSWYEASAYARWVGKRLPSEAEWQKAASCPVMVGAGTLVQRKFPWGDSMDRSRANVWGSGHDGPVAVAEYRAGASMGSLHQLIGNVWEWTHDDFGVDVGRSGLLLPTPMKCIRGGAFDTYFDHQASAAFQSGENPMNRKHNVGFRCAVSFRDLDPPARGRVEETAGSETPPRKAAALSEART